VHGGDFTLLGSDEDLDWFEKMIKEKFEVKVRGRLGPGLNDTKSIRILNRIVEWSQDGLWYEAYQRHADTCLKKKLGLDHDKVRSELPGERVAHEEEDEEWLPTHEVKRYQALIARANDLAQDRSDIQFSVKELDRCQPQREGHGRGL